jgi:hypothetical protein
VDRANAETSAGKRSQTQSRAEAAAAVTIAVAYEGSPPEMLLALDQVLDVFSRLPDPSPERWLNLLSAVQLNLFRAITNWNNVDHRSVVVNQLRDKLLCDLAMLDLPDAQVMGHG